MNLDNLGKIKRAEASPFLFTKIQQKIEQSERERMPKAIALTMSVAFVLLLVINTLTIARYPSKNNTTKSLAQWMHLTSNNSLYNE